MIAIVDNGEEYSDHRVFFFEGGVDDCAKIEAALKGQTSSSHSMPSIIGMAPVIEWRADGNTLPTKEFWTRVGWLCVCGHFNKHYYDECVQCDRPQPKESP